MTGPKLPDGPPPRKLETSFTPRELEFIELRYNQAKGYKEIAAGWNLSVSYVRSLGTLVYMKLDLINTGFDTITLGLVAMKKLIQLGYIKIERENT